MKRSLPLLLLLSLLLSGCFSAERLKEPVQFYYVRDEFTYFSKDGVIAGEAREASGHREDLPYLLKLYLLGPSEDDLTAVFPADAHLNNLARTDTETVITLSDVGDTMTDAAYSLGCACLAKTCFELTDTQIITIQSADRCVTVTREELLLTDDYHTPMEESDQ